MRATATSLLLAAALVVLVPSAAFAHASFDLGQVPAGSAQELVLRVPLEREAANDRVEVLVPGAFVVDACAAAPGWTCEQAATDDGDTVVTLARQPEGAGDTERFTLTLTAPATEGVYAFPTIQTYDDGVESSWIGAPDSDRPAPRLQVGDETSPVASNGDATPHTDLATPRPTATADPGPTAAPGPTDEPSTPPATATPSPAVSADAAPAADTGPSPVLVVAGIALAAVAVAGAVARLRSV